MKYFIIIIILLSLIVIKSSAQTITPLIITYHRKLYNIKELPFNKVIVFDNRFDTTKIQITEDAMYPITIIQFSKPATEAIKTYIETSISNYKKKDRLLYISIKQMRYTNLNHSFIFHADAYFLINNYFKKIATIRNDDYRTDGFQKTITKALNELIEKVNSNYYKKNNVETNNYTLDSVNANVINDWKIYPVVSQSIYTNGVFESFDDFQNNIIKPVNFSMQANSDSSVFGVLFSENRKYYSERNNQYHHVFAVCYNNNLYIQVLGKYLLALNKLNNTFYFNVPHSLPNMYAIRSEKLLQIPNVQNNQMSSSTNPEIALVGVGIGIAKQNKVNIEVHNKKQEIIDIGLIRGDLRTCFLDMDTGDIIYY